MKYLKEKTSSDVKVFLIGNKSDLEESRLITKDQGLKFKKDNNLYFFTETSAKLGTNVREIFFEAAKVLYNDYFKDKQLKNFIKEFSEEKIENNEEIEETKQIQIAAFSTNENKKNPNDIIQIFLEQQNHKLIQKSENLIVFTTNLNNSLSETRIVIYPILNLSKNMLLFIK